MQNTTNFNFNLPEGTDLWNYLTQTNPNFTALDSILKSVQDGTVTTATEVTSGTAHAVTRTLPDANVIRFTATGVWTLGDTMTIDGTPVTVVKPNGTSLQTGDYIIGSEVLGVLRATQFTVYLGVPSSLDAADISYDNTESGLTANDVQGAIDEVNSKLSHYTVVRTVTGNAGITLGQLCDQLFGADIYNGKYKLFAENTATGTTQILDMSMITSSYIIFSQTYVTFVPTTVFNVYYVIASSGSSITQESGGTISDLTSISSANVKLHLVY